MWLVADAVLRMSTALQEKNDNMSMLTHSGAPPSSPGHVSKLTANWAETHGLGKPCQQPGDLCWLDACGTASFPALAAGLVGRQVTALFSHFCNKSEVPDNKADPEGSRGGKQTPPSTSPLGSFHLRDGHFLIHVSSWEPGQCAGGQTQPPCSCRDVLGDLLHQTQLLWGFGSRQNTSYCFPRHAPSLSTLCRRTLLAFRSGRQQRAGTTFN